MKTVKISQAALDRNTLWIEAVERALARYGDSRLAKDVMKAAGSKCARQIIDECEEILGRKLQSVDELLAATNKRRFQKVKSTSLWERNGNTARLVIDQCGCTLVRAGLAKPNPVHCLCSVGMIESLFTEMCRGPVQVKAVKTIGYGDKCCEFRVEF